MSPIDQLKAVLCDPSGKCCIDGSDEDRAIIDRALQALAQPDNTSDSATRSADSAESFCKQELHNLMSVAGRMALELECLLLDTENLSVVSKWWDTGMEALQAYRNYVWSVTHGKDKENFCDTHCVHTDHHPDCELAQPSQEPMFWYRPLRDGMYEGPIHNNSVGGKMYRDEAPNEWKPLYTASISEPVKERISEPVENLEPVAWMYPSDLKAFETNEATATAFSIKVGCPDEVSVPLYTAPPKREWQGLTDDEIDTAWRVADYTESYGKFRITVARAIEAKLKEKNT